MTVRPPADKASNTPQAGTPAPAAKRRSPQIPAVRPPPEPAADHISTQPGRPDKFGAQAGQANKPTARPTAPPESLYKSFGSAVWHGNSQPIYVSLHVNKAQPRRTAAGGQQAPRGLGQPPAGGLREHLGAGTRGVAPRPQRAAEGAPLELAAPQGGDSERAGGADTLPRLPAIRLKKKEAPAPEPQHGINLRTHLGAGSRDRAPQPRFAPPADWRATSQQEDSDTPTAPQDTLPRLNAFRGRPKVR